VVDRADIPRVPELMELPEELREPLRPLLDCVRGLVEALSDPEDEAPDDAGMADRVTVIEEEQRRRRLPVLPPSGGDIVPIYPDPDATRTTLGQTQGTQDVDTWTHGKTEKGCEIQIITDIKADGATMTLSYRTRTAKVDPNGFIVAISAESELVTVDIGGACP